MVYFGEGSMVNQGGFNPVGTDWQTMQQGNYENMQQHLHDDKTSQFFQRHPNLIPVFFKKKEEHDRKEFCRFNIDYGIKDALVFLMEDVKRQNASDTTTSNSANAVIAKLNRMTTDNVVVGAQMIYEGMDLTSEQFIALEQIQQTMQANHNIAMSEGYGYQNPQETAYTTSWGVSYQNPNNQQWQYQPHTQDPYAQQGQYGQNYPNQTPHGMYNPHQQNGGMVGGLLGLGVGLLG